MTHVIDLRMAYPLSFLSVLFAVAFLAAFGGCTSETESPKEDYALLLLVVWDQAGESHGLLSFEGSEDSGTGTRMVGDIVVETFEYRWIAPTVIEVDRGEITELKVRFRDKGETLDLEGAPWTLEDEAIRYSRIRTIGATTDND